MNTVQYKKYKNMYVVILDAQFGRKVKIQFRNAATDEGEHRSVIMFHVAALLWK
jgi:hypothetical protein